MRVLRLILHRNSLLRHLYIAIICFSVLLLMCGLSADLMAGTTAQLVKDINPGAPGSGSSYLTEMDGMLYFQANDGSNGAELWKSDGTESGTVMVKEINPGIGGASPWLMAVIGGTIYFQANDGTNGIELWKSDGTESGTVMVKDINPGSGSSAPQYAVVVGGNIFFRANDGSNGVELWKSDGTASGTVMVKDICAGSVSSNPNHLTEMNGTIYFQATDGTNGYELWKSDGTSSGTVMVKDINPGAANSYPSQMAVLSGALYFQANDGTNGYELWKSNGTASGTSMIGDFNPGAGNFDPRYMTAMGGALYFSADDGTNGIELWKSDGTFSGTVMVKDIYVGYNSRPIYLTEMNGILYFQAEDPAKGKELWKSDGTFSGTVMVKDIYGGLGSSTPQYLTAMGGLLYFQATDGINGVELWESGGSESNTVMVKDINPGSGGSSPYYLTAFGGSLFFQANDGSSGAELWRTVEAPICVLSPDGLDFGVLAPGDSKDSTFTITNEGGGTLSGTVSELCEHFSIVSGGGPYSLGNGESVVVTVRFEPAANGDFSCNIETGSTECGIFACTGMGDNTIPVMVQQYTSHWEGNHVEIAWIIADLSIPVTFEVYRKTGTDRAYGEIAAPQISRSDNEFIFQDHSTEPGKTYGYRVLVKENDEITTSFETLFTTPSFALALKQNHPNPFNPATTIEFTLDRERTVVLAIYDVTGRLVRTLVNQRLAAGTHAEEWDARDQNGCALASGIYFYSLKAGDKVQTRKAVLLK